jgi:hypothetical protein
VVSQEELVVSAAGAELEMNNRVAAKFHLEVCGARIAVGSTNAEATTLLLTNYAKMRQSSLSAEINYTVGKSAVPRRFFLTKNDGKCIRAKHTGELLYLFDSDLMGELQRVRRDLFFVHAAALEYNGKACMLLAPPKSGKSVTALGLLQHGFGYLSDELAPLDLVALKVYPYPRALWLRPGAPGPRLPKTTLRTDWMLCVSSPTAIPSKHPSIGAIIFLQHIPGANRPSTRVVGQAEAAARILAATLNPSAHEENGLVAAAKIASHVPSVEVSTAGLAETCLLIKEIFAHHCPIKEVATSAGVKV